MKDISFAEPLNLSEELLMIRQVLRRFIDKEILPYADQWEIDGKIPRSVFKSLGGLGLLGMRHPVADGGTEMGPVASVLFSEELARSSYGGIPAAVLVQTDMSATHISRRGNEAQRRKYLPGIISGDTIVAIAVTEPGAGSDVAGLKTRAVRDGDDFVINGAKTFITNGYYGDLYIIAARTDPDAKGSRGISLFLVERDTPGLIIGKKLLKHGDLSSDTAELFFEDLRVPAESLLGELHKGFYAIMDNFQNERLVLAGSSTGASMKALEITLEYVRMRELFGGTLWDLQATRQKLAMLATKISAARALTYHAAALDERGVDCIVEISQAKIMATEVHVEVTNSCLQLHGGTGYMNGTAIERMVRDARLQTIGGGATEVMLEEIAKRI